MTWYHHSQSLDFGYSDIESFLKNDVSVTSLLILIIHGTLKNSLFSILAMPWLLMVLSFIQSDNAESSESSLSLDSQALQSL